MMIGAGRMTATARADIRNPQPRGVGRSPGKLRSMKGRKCSGTEILWERHLSDLRARFAVFVSARKSRFFASRRMTPLRMP
jgi:hypothetical protein